MSVLGLDSGYTVKYTPPPSGIPSHLCLLKTKLSKKTGNWGQGDFDNVQI